MNWVVLQIFYFVPPKNEAGNAPVWRISYEWILTTTEWRILKWFQKMLIYPKIIGSFVFLFEVPHFFWRGSLNFTVFKDIPQKKRAWNLGFWCHIFHDHPLMSDFYQLGEPTYPEILEVFWATSWCLNTSPKNHGISKLVGTGDPNEPYYRESKSVQWFLGFILFRFAGGASQQFTWIFSNKKPPRLRV